MPTLKFDDPFDFNVTISRAFEHILPVNLFLSAFILLQNSIILVDYYPDRRKLVISLFMLIAILDMILAFGTVLEAIPAIICLNSSQAEIHTNLLYFPIAGTSYIISVSTNAVLSVTKTISIRNPFARINKTAVYSILIIISSFWIISIALGFTATSLDLYYDWFNNTRWENYTLWENDTLCADQWFKMGLGNPASGFAFHWIFPFLAGSAVEVLVLFEAILPFFLPSIAVFVCMIIQMIYIRKYLSSERSEESREAYHVNVTVFSVSTLYVICTIFHSPVIIALATSMDPGNLIWGGGGVR